MGLPLAIEFRKKYKVLGFDINNGRIEELKIGKDRTNEADLEGLQFSMNLANESDKVGLCFSSNIEHLKSHNEFLNLDFDELKKHSDSILFDIKGFLPRKLVDSRL